MNTPIVADNRKRFVFIDDLSPFGRYRPRLLPRMIIALMRVSFLNHGSFRRILEKPVYRLHPGPIDQCVWGQNVRLYPRSNVSDRKALFRPNRFDPKEFAFLASILRQGSGHTFIDIGANAGFYSLFALTRAARNDMRLLAFEPNPVMFRRLAFNLRGFSGEKVRLLPMALGDWDGTAKFELMKNLGASRISEDKGQIEVPIRRLAGVLKAEGIERIDVLKIDVEGYEDRVLEPFFAEAPEQLWPRYIFIEHLMRKEWKTDCIETAEANCYKILFATRSNAVLCRAGDCARERRNDYGAADIAEGQQGHQRQSVDRAKGRQANQEVPGLSL